MVQPAKFEKNRNFHYLMRRENIFFPDAKDIIVVLCSTKFWISQKRRQQKSSNLSWGVLGTFMLYGKSRTVTPCNKRVIRLRFLFTCLFNLGICRSNLMYFSKICRLWISLPKSATVSNLDRLIIISVILKFTSR